MTKDIKTVTVIGAGAMGSGIAAHLANAGIKVHLLDIVPKNASDRDVIAKGAIDRMKKANAATDPLSAGFMDPANAKRITPGNMDDHLEAAVKNSDWVIEVIIEDLGLKQKLFERIDSFRKPGTIVTSNTSTIPLHDLIEGRSGDFRKNFAITHFFNPPRFMRLLEMVSGKETSPEVTQTLNDFCDVRLGKNVIHCNDTPAFIANRIGTYFLFRAIAETIDKGLKIEDVDAVLGKPMGMPKDGVFGLLDLVGIGITPHLKDSLMRTLPADDEFRKIDSVPAMNIITTMLADGRTGRRADKGGFYRMQKNEDGSKVKQTLDLRTGDYHQVQKKSLPAVKAGKKGPRAVFETGGRLSDLSWVVMRDTLLYVTSLVPAISNNIADIDAAMKDGYNWKYGPFELLDKIGVDWFINKVKADGLPIPPVLQMAEGHKFYDIKHDRPQLMTFDFTANKAGKTDINKPAGIVSLSDLKRGQKPLVSHFSASLWDVGDGVACFEFHSKMNTMDPSVLHALNESIKFISANKDKYKAMVIYNDEKNFSFGANLGILSAGFNLAHNKFIKAMHLDKPIERSMYKVVDNLVYQGQAVYKALREAPFPVVGAPSGMAFGGGCEILLHCDALQADAETYMGLVESGVGVIPGWGGCARTLERVSKAQSAGLIQGGPFPPVRQAFMALMMPQFSVSASAQDGKKKLWLNPKDGITMNRARLLNDAKAKVLTMIDGYKPPQPATYSLTGPDAATSIRGAIDDLYLAGQATYHDAVVGEALANVLTGDDTHVGKVITEVDILNLERKNFLSLVYTQQTKDRISYMLKHSKPLREGPTDKTLDEIRANRKSITVPARIYDGKPLTGKDDQTLRRMAAVTAFLMKRMA